MRPGLACQPHGTHELEGETVVEVGIREVEEIAALGGAGRMHQDVDASESAQCRLHRHRRGRRLAQVAGKSGGAPADLLDGTAYPARAAPSRATSTTSAPSRASLLGAGPADARLSAPLTRQACLAVPGSCCPRPSLPKPQIDSQPPSMAIGLPVIRSPHRCTGTRSAARPSRRSRSGPMSAASSGIPGPQYPSRFCRAPCARAPVARRGVS